LKITSIGEVIPNIFINVLFLIQINYSHIKYGSE